MFGEDEEEEIDIHDVKVDACHCIYVERSKIYVVHYVRYWVKY